MIFLSMFLFSVGKLEVLKELLYNSAEVVIFVGP
jgi:hypothetical protein